MFPMAHSKTQQHDEGVALEELAALYPLAFALASASNFRTGLILRRRESTRLLLIANPASRQDPFTENASNPPQ